MLIGGTVDCRLNSYAVHTQKPTSKIQVYGISAHHYTQTNIIEQCALIIFVHEAKWYIYTDCSYTDKLI